MINNKVYIALLAFLATSVSQSTNSSSISKPGNNSTASPSQIKTCFIEKTRRVRTFPTLVDYQGNHYSFDPRDPTYQGNIVNFSFTTIYNLSTNDFVSFGSDSIMEIDLHHKEIKSVGTGTFKGLFCLSKLDLSFNNLSMVTEGSFEGLENLKQLDLSHNQLVDIPDSGMAFLALKNIEVLDLSFNKIRSISKLSFMFLYNLEILNLGHNKIKTIDDRVFNYLTQLKELSLNDNLLVETFAEKWNGLENLTSLDLSDNYLTSFDTGNNYTFYNLKRLNLSGNSLQHFNVYWLRKNFPALVSLDLANNSWFCEDLESIKHGIIDLRITIPREVGCSEIKTTSVKTTTTQSTTAVPTRGAVQTSSQPQVNYGVELLKQNGKIIESNKELVMAVDSLRTMVIIVFLVVIIGMVIGIGERAGCFKNLSQQVRGRSNRGYLDSNDIESVGLISR
ncbi:unnamed protein product [Psylliodes chrysocephalus]|uniref:Uncharacterized protein n=1 Tax=Psylliodes chrysocephalus TaxID=3402493 RepID=A0A9P0DEF5_9CUCU|nr:unnamed protein product [Psylliodes chrysocephala]